MGRKSKGARLYLRPARKDGEPARWVIRDGTTEIGVGCGAGDRLQAEARLQEYLEGRQQKEPVYVYFITAAAQDFPIKIGLTANRFARFTALQTALPYEVEIIGFWAVEDHSIERKIHKRFAHLRLRGEWFRRAPELLEFIREVDGS
jgi:hypothetical protein